MGRHQVTFNDIKLIKCPTEEAETTITYMRKEKIALIYTSDNTTVTKIRRQFADMLHEVVVYEADYIDGEPSGYFFEVPKKLIHFKKWRDKSKAKEESEAENEEDNENEEE